MLSSTSSRQGLFRARGGGPKFRVTYPVGDHVSSARARVDPLGTTSPTPTTSLFRARAGGPWNISIRADLGESLPRARGWTQDHHARGLARIVSSARARVDPGTNTACGSRRRLFRARAGGPDEWGMISGGKQSLPRARGWTRAAVIQEVSLVVSSARARVDPTRSCWTRWRRRLFRARAGGPSGETGRLADVESLPRARGWNRDVDVPKRRRCVSSARARVEPV